MQPERTPMSKDSKVPSFEDFARWLALRSPQPARNEARYERLHAAALQARGEFLAAQRGIAPHLEPSAQYGYFEVLELLAAADKSESPRPADLTTARGFRVTLAFEEGGSGDASSICVLVQCPPELTESVQGETAYLWNGPQRFELGQFDAEGKAIGTLPAGIEISPSDFALGNVKLEEPPAGE
jgi:hypothetical protein